MHPTRHVRSSILVVIYECVKKHTQRSCLHPGSDYHSCIECSRSQVWLFRRPRESNAVIAYLAIFISFLNGMETCTTKKCGWCNNLSEGGSAGVDLLCRNKGFKESGDSRGHWLRSGIACWSRRAANMLRILFAQIECRILLCTMRSSLRGLLRDG